MTEIFKELEETEEGFEELTNEEKIKEAVNAYIEEIVDYRDNDEEKNFPTEEQLQDIRKKYFSDDQIENLFSIKKTSGTEAILHKRHAYQMATGILVKTGRLPTAKDIDGITLSLGIDKDKETCDMIKEELIKDYVRESVVSIAQENESE